MGYLVVEMIVLLLIAAAIGFIIGWFLRGGGTAASDVEADYSKRLAAAEKKAADLNKELQEDQSEIEQLRGQLEATRREVDEERKRSGELEGEMGGIRDKEAALAAALSDVSNRENEIERLKAELEAARAQAGSEDRVAALQSEADRLRSELETARAAHADSAENIAALNARIAELEAAGAGASDQAELASLDAAPQAAPEPEPKPAASSGGSKPRPSWLLDAPDGEIDDFKRIKGVGPVMERTLNKLGIYHFRQVAKLDAEGIDWVSTNIETFPDRIVRDDWVGQARALHTEKYGSAP